MALSKQPDPIDLSQPNDNLEEPLRHSSLAIPFLVNFLTEHPDEKLHVTDLRSNTPPGPDDGLLLIGPCKTLQAKFGLNRFAVISNPGRFQLTPESAARLQEVKTQNELGKTAVTIEPVDVDIFRAFLVARVQRTVKAEEPPENEALRQFKDKLKEFLRIPKHITASTIGLTIICDKPRIVHDYVKMAERAGFIIVHLLNPNGKTAYQAVIGDEIGALLKNALIDSGYRSIANTLLRTDDNEFGPYALVFHPAHAELLILNKCEATQKYRPMQRK